MITSKLDLRDYYARFNQYQLAMLLEFERAKFAQQPSIYHARLCAIARLQLLRKTDNLDFLCKCESYCTANLDQGVWSGRWGSA